MDWNKFNFEYSLDFNEVLRPIISIEAYKEAAMSLCLPPDWRDQLDRLNRVRAVHGTTALEGNPLSEEEVSRQIEVVDKSTQAAATREQLQIRNAAIAQLWIRMRFCQHCDPLTLADILKMHELVTVQSDTRNNVPGRFRTADVTVGSPDMGGVHKGAPAQRVESLMQEYVDFVNSRKVVEGLHPVMRALLAHFYLVTIHPFGDGNGRVSRLVEAGILFQGDYNVHGFYGLSNYFYRNERDYKVMLQKCREIQPFNVTPFVLFGLHGFAMELKGINSFIKTKLNRVVYRDMLVRSFSKRTGPRRRLLNQREYNLILYLLVATEPVDPFSDVPSRRISVSELSDSQYVRGAYARVKPRTFIRELTRLGKMGFINFRKDEEAKDWIVELDFEAIGRY